MTTALSPQVESPADRVYADADAADAGIRRAVDQLLRKERIELSRAATAEARGNEALAEYYRERAAHYSDQAISLISF